MRMTLKLNVIIVITSGKVHELTALKQVTVPARTMPTIYSHLTCVHVIPTLRRCESSKGIPCLPAHVQGGGLRRACSQRSGRNSSGRSQLAAVRWMAVMGMCSSTCGGTTSLPPPSVTGLPVVARRKVAMPPAGYSRMVSCARQ